jgi:alpha-galactosidase
MGVVARATTPIGAYVHLQAETVSLLVDVGDPSSAPSRPRLLHWGPALPLDLDLVAFDRALVAPVPLSTLDRPLGRPLAPMPVDGWRMRPWLTGARPDGTGWSPDLVCVGAYADRVDGAQLLDLVLGDAAAGLTLEVRLALDAAGVLSITQRLTNLGDTAYHLQLLAAILPLPALAREILDLTGRWCRERSPQRHDLAHGAWLREGRHGRSGHDAPLVLAVGTPGFSFENGQVYAVHHAWSGDSVLWAERSPVGRAQLGAGERLEPGEVVLDPGQSYLAPTLLAAYSPAGLNGISDAFHAYVRARSTHPHSPRPVIFNSWEAVYFDHRLDRLRELVDAAAAAGAERFVLDDGWFGGRRSDLAGLGDWVVSSAVWPDGLGPLVDYVTSLGMQFGLWVEPEMVNPDSDLYRAHPDWVLATPGHQAPLWRHQLVLDLGRPEVRDYLAERLGALLDDYAISYLKWDHNRDLVDASSAGRSGAHAQTLGVYDLLDRLRAAHPDVEIESCASGGGRADLGILARTDRVWASDTIDPLERQQIQLWTGLLLPPELIGSHIGSAPAHTTGRTHSLPFRAATALFGHLGVELDLTRATATDIADIGAAITAYRQLRGLLHTGRVVRGDHPDPAMLVHGVVAPDRREAVYAIVALATSIDEIPSPVRLPGLDPDRTYRVQRLSVGGHAALGPAALPPWVLSGATLPGRVLDTVGLQPPVLQPEQALVLHVTAEGDPGEPTHHC